MVTVRETETRTLARGSINSGVCNKDTCEAEWSHNHARRIIFAETVVLTTGEVTRFFNGSVKDINYVKFAVEERRGILTSRYVTGASLKRVFSKENLASYFMTHESKKLPFVNFEENGDTCVIPCTDEKTAVRLLDKRLRLEEERAFLSTQDDFIDYQYRIVSPSHLEVIYDTTNFYLNNRKIKEFNTLSSADYISTAESSINDSIYCSGGINIDDRTRNINKFLALFDYADSFNLPRNLHHWTDILYFVPRSGVIEIPDDIQSVNLVLRYNNQKLKIKMKRRVYENLFRRNKFNIYADSDGLFEMQLY